MDIKRSTDTETLYRKALLEIKNFPISENRTHLDIIHILQDIAEDGLAEWLKSGEQVVTIQESFIDHLQGEVSRLNNIIRLLAGEVDINNEVWDALSAEYDYDVISSWAKGNEGWQG